MQRAIDSAVIETGAMSVKDMGRVIDFLKSSFAGQMDFSLAGQIVKTELMRKSNILLTLGTKQSTSIS